MACSWPPGKRRPGVRSCSPGSLTAGAARPAAQAHAASVRPSAEEAQGGQERLEVTQRQESPVHSWGLFFRVLFTPFLLFPTAGLLCPSLGAAVLGPLHAGDSLSFGVPATEGTHVKFRCLAGGPLLPSASCGIGSALHAGPGARFWLN